VRKTQAVIEKRREANLNRDANRWLQIETHN